VVNVSDGFIVKTPPIEEILIEELWFFGET